MTKVCTLGAVVSKHRIRHIRSSDAPARRCGSNTLKVCPPAGRCLRYTVMSSDQRESRHDSHDGIRHIEPHNKTSVLIAQKILL